MYTSHIRVFHHLNRLFTVKMQQVTFEIKQKVTVYLYRVFTIFPEGLTIFEALSEEINKPSRSKLNLRARFKEKYSLLMRLSTSFFTCSGESIMRDLVVYITSSDLCCRQISYFTYLSHPEELQYPKVSQSYDLRPMVLQNNKLDKVRANNCK